MMKEKSPFDTLDQGQDLFMPNISVDCIILGFHEGNLKILLCKFKVTDKWMLPGGFIGKEEDPDEAAMRILEGRVGLRNVYLKQFYFFGKKNRVNLDEHRKILKGFHVDPERAKWYMSRFMSLGYFSLIRYDHASVSAREYEDVAWFDINVLPPLYGDHKEIIDTALNTIRQQIGYVPIGYNLLPHKFTMPELRSIYETILGREIDRRNFQRKMLSIGFIKALNQKRKAGAHKSPNLYSFIKDKYDEAERNGLQIMSNHF